MTHKFLVILQLTSLLLSLGAQAAPGDENWDNRFALPPGLDGPVSSMTTIGKNLYVAGDFKHAGALEVNGLACWNGQSWSALLSTSDFSGLIYTLASDGKNLFIGGWFVIPSITATNIAKWNGSSWERLGNGVSTDCAGRLGVNALVIKGNVIYAGGSFSRAGSVPANNVAVWDGRAWSTLGPGLGGNCFDDQGYGAVNALAVRGSSLYAGGIFHNAGSLRVTNLAVWDGRSWSSVGGGVSGGVGFSYVFGGTNELYSGAVSALYASGNGLYVGGYFTAAGTLPASNIALWNGKSWDNLNGGLTSPRPDVRVSAITSSQRGLVVGGRFDRADSVSAQNIARWDGSSWIAIGAGFSGPVFALADALYAGGDFGLSGQTQAAFIARLDGDRWNPLQPGTGNAPIGTAVGISAAHGKAYPFGNLTSAGSVPVQNVAQWNHENWSNLGGGIPAFVFEGVVARSNFYARGFFELPAIGATNVACWNGQNWSGLPRLDQLPADALTRLGTMAGDDTHLYVQLYGDSSLYSWDGQQWSALGRAIGVEGAPGYISQLVASEGDLYVIGSFEAVGGVLAHSIAQWNGQSWLDLGGRLSDIGFQNAFVQSAAAVGDRLYVLGSSFVAAWNGSAWHCLLQGQNLPISSLAANHRFLYVGGFFTEIGGISAQNIARFDGINWFSLGSGLDGGPGFRGLAADENNVYVSGQFTSAGGKPSYRFAIWHEPQ